MSGVYVLPYVMSLSGSSAISGLVIARTGMSFYLYPLCTDVPCTDWDLQGAIRK